MRNLLLSLLVGISAQAKNIVIEKHDQCVPASIDQVFNILTNYDGYSQLPGAVYEMKTPLIGNIRLLGMVKSQSKMIQKQEQNSEAMLWLVLQPTNLTEADLYPRFLSKCVSLGREQGKFEHQCQMDTAKQHFGINNFQTHLVVVQDEMKCPKNQAQVNYEVIIDLNESDINQIEDRVLGKAGILAPILKAMFNDEGFIRSYFENFYEKLLSGYQN